MLHLRSEVSNVMTHGPFIFVFQVTVVLRWVGITGISGFKDRTKEAFRG